MWPFNRKKLNPEPDAIGPKAAGIVYGGRENEPRDLTALVNAIEADYQFKLGYLTILGLITSVEFTAPETGDSRANALSQNLLNRWKAAIPHAFRAFAYGRAQFEQWYRYSGSMLELAGLEPLPYDLATPEFDDNGLYCGLTVKAERSKDKVSLQAEDTWYFALDGSSVAPWGRSRYLGAAQAVLRERQEIAKQRKKWFSKLAIGKAVARYPWDENATTAVAANLPLQKLKKALEEIDSGGTLLLPATRERDASGGMTGPYKYDYVESQGMRDSSALVAETSRLDSAALRSIAVPERAVTQDAEVGTNAMSQAHQLILASNADEVLEQMYASFESQVIKRACYVNSVPAIQFSWKGLRAQLMEKAAQQPAAPAAPFSAQLAIGDAAPVIPVEEISKRAAAEAAAIWAAIEQVANERNADAWGRL